MAALSISPAWQNPKSNQNPGRNLRIVAPAFGKATIHDFDGLFWLPPAGIQPAGERKATKTPAKARFGLHSVMI